MAEVPPGEGEEDHPHLVALVREGKFCLFECA